MTLKEKFKQWLDTDPRVQIREVQLEVIADEFAIGFADWLDTLKPYQRVSFWSKNGEYRGKFDMDNEQLLKIYKKEKGL